MPPQNQCPENSQKLDANETGPKAITLPGRRVNRAAAKLLLACSGVDEDEVTVADFLKDQGYVTRMIGKWHLGFELHGEGPRGKTFDFSKPLAGGPLDCGFDSYFGVRKAVSGPRSAMRR